MIILEKFGKGWRDKFEDKLQTLFSKLPDITLNNIERYKGMLRINIQSLDKGTQYIVDCVTYVIERESVRTCELCGAYGFRRQHDEWMLETKCLCLPCYTIEIDNTLSQQNK
jgi:hypothetical protein